MADRAISDLSRATSVGREDLLVIQQGSQAKSVTGGVLIRDLATELDGHGGISDITYTPPVSPSLNGTMVITLADGNEVSLTVTNGNGITSISKTGTSALTDTYTILYTNGESSTFAIVNGRGIAQLDTSESGTDGDGKTHTLNFLYNDGTTDTITLRDGIKGDTGDAWYTDFKWASDLPSSNSDLSSIPDNWIGVYFGTKAPSALNYSDYLWFEYKGAKGDTGAPATLARDDIAYQWSQNGTVVPNGTWSPTIPERVTGSNYLWTRITLNFNSGSPVVAYSIGHYGEDGLGAVSTVNAISPVEGNVTITASDIQTNDNRNVQTRLDDSESDITELKTYEALHIDGAAFSSMPHTINNAAITEDMRVVELTFGTPGVITSDVEWTTDNGSIVLSGTMNGSTTVDLILIKTN